MNRSYNDPTWLAEEQTLIGRAVAGDRDAFASLYRAFARPLYAQVLLPRLASPALAEEVLADTFATALERLPTFEARSVSLWFWLVSIASHRIADCFRARARTDRAMGALEKALDADGPPPDPATAVERVHAHQEMRTRIARVLELINPRYARVIRLRVLEEHPRPVCAEALGVTLGTFDVLMLRSLRAFQRAWLAEGGQEVA